MMVLKMPSVLCQWRGCFFYQEEGVSNVEFTGPGGEPLPDDSSVGDAAWHGGFDMTLDGNQVCSSMTAP